MTYNQFKDKYDNGGIFRISKKKFAIGNFTFSASIPFADLNDVGVLFAVYKHDKEYSAYVDRKESDLNLFRNLRRFSKTKIIYCIFAYIIVRTFGWIYWYDINRIIK